MGEDDMEDTSLIEPIAEAMDIGKRAVEATLFAAEKPMTIAEIRAYVGDELDVRQILADLQEDFQHRGIVLVRAGERWHFQTANDLSHLLRRERAELRKLSRAGMETLAIIAYHEPVSRAEIEAIRGVQVAKGTLDVLMETGWVRPAGRREVPGRPLIYATTNEFLTHFGLQSRRDLPGIEDLRAAGLLDPVDMALEQLELEAEAENEAEQDSDESEEREFAADDGVLLEKHDESA
jgi:segregation and condensation protein B